MVIIDSSHGGRPVLTTTTGSPRVLLHVKMSFDASMGLGSASGVFLGGGAVAAGGHALGRLSSCLSLKRKQELKCVCSAPSVFSVRSRKGKFHPHSRRDTERDENE